MKQIYNDDDWDRLIKQLIRKAGKRVHAAVKDLQEKGVIDKKGQLIKTP